jgi:RNA polymerase sigma factor (sigma-70 family)
MSTLESLPSPQDLTADQVPALVARTQDRLLALGRKIVGELHEAADVVNTAYFRLWQALRAGEAIRSPDGWLVRAVRNLAIDARRRRRRHAVAGGDPDAVADPAADTRRTALRLDVDQLLEAARAACGELAVVALWRMKAEGLRAHDVALELGITRRQAYHLAARAEEWLRRHTTP